MSFKEGIAICTYNRANRLVEVLDGVLSNKPANARVIVCDDGSTDDTMAILKDFSSEISYIRGPNMGVGANKNRALFALRSCDFLAILEDDLVPIAPGWFETYREFCLHTNIHHFCRVQDKEVPESVIDFGEWCASALKLTPIYGSSPRGDLTFISNMVIRKVGAIHPEFIGVGHAHGQWSDRVAASELINHPNKWIDVKEARDKFIQIGDTEGGRWNEPTAKIREQIQRNSDLRKRLGTELLYIEPFLP